jgi:hypothetical protein
MSLRLAALPAALVVALAGAAAAHAAPIPNAALATSLPTHTGAAAHAHATPRTRAPQNPFMARSPGSNIHNDTWMTDAYAGAGPLGTRLNAFSYGYGPALCGTLTFDTHGNIVTVCPSSVAPPQARIVNARTLAPIATMTLPTAPDAPGTEAYQNFTGGGYFYLDQRDRIVEATKTRHIWLIDENAAGTTLTKTKDWDLTPYLTSDERITSALPDWKGRIWFVSKKNGKIGTLDPKTGRVRVMELGEEVENSFAVDKKGVFIVSDKRMYRFDTTKDGTPKVTWKVTYANSGVRKPSQVDAGSGTTPTIMPHGMVSITDNADPMHVVVYRTAVRLTHGQKRTVCAVPVFRKGASATENSLISAGRSLIVENNYGYHDPLAPGAANPVTSPGVTRIDVNAKGTGCRKAWTSPERAPTVVPKLSTKTGLVYLYTRDPDPNGSQSWFWTAVDFRTGRTVWKQYAGSGLGFNNNYAGLAIGPTRTAYLGTIGGLIALKDG